jgi:16S rRNA (cytosine1402-N4)-methyltransferase
LALSLLVGPDGRVIAIDQDSLAIKNFKNRLSRDSDKFKNLIIVHDNFKNLRQIVNEQIENKKISQVNGIVFDLGLSSAQLEDPDRGFSFQVDAPLDMNFGQADRSAMSIINRSSEHELADIIYEYGEERYSRRIARSIAASRKNQPIKTTLELVAAIKQALPPRVRYGQKIHFATRTFQALRIATNNELENLRLALFDAIELLAPGGRLAVVSYHSLEDRIVKNIFRDLSGYSGGKRQTAGRPPAIELLNKKVIIPGDDEIRKNPRARSAKLRAARKI